MLGGLWDRITGRSRQKALDREAELEKMTPEERRQVQEYVEDIHADDSAAAHLGGFDPDRLLPGEKEPPRN